MVTEPLIDPASRPYRGMSKRIVVHRDHTFQYGGHTFYLAYGGPGWGYEVRLGDLYGPTVAESLFTHEEVRAYFPRHFETDDVQRHLPPDKTD